MLLSIQPDLRLMTMYMNSNIVANGWSAALALNIHGALGETSFNFAISYAAIRGLLVIEVLAGRE